MEPTCLLLHTSMLPIHVFSALIVWFTTTIIYRHFFHQLAKFPGPLLPAITYLYDFYFDVLRSGHFYKEIGRPHDKYGESEVKKPYLKVPILSFGEGRT